MREILFRAKRVDNGEWVEGSLVVLKGKCFIFIETKPSKVKSLSFKTHKLVVECVEVIPETVGEFTGLCDKNGKKVFEGDILSIETDIGQCVKDIWKNVTKSRDEGFGICFYTRQDEAIVRFNQYRCEFDLKVYNNGKYKRIAKFNKSSLNYYNAEIIGNIHDNAELLEVENEQ